MEAHSYTLSCKGTLRERLMVVETICTSKWLSYPTITEACQSLATASLRENPEDLDDWLARWAPRLGPLPFRTVEDFG